LRILFDTNVVLDLLLDRKPHAVSASRLISAVEGKRLGAFLCATSVTTLDYLITRTLGRAETLPIIRALLGLFDFAPVTRAVLESALDLEFADYEGAVIHEAARAVEADGIVTRNVPDFAGSRLAIYSPAELVAALADS
jgi:predicted nucleic acid-binding protein